MTLLGRLNPLRSFSHGVHPPEFKELTEHKPIRRLPFPPEVVVPLSQHIGAPAKPIVREGQEVVRGEPVAEAVGFVSVPMHAPATGTVRAIRLVRNVRGEMAPAIIIDPYPGDSQEILYGSPLDITNLSGEDLIKAVQSTGVVGLGGAAFPTHVKLASPKDKPIDTVIANGCECEPYLTTDHRVMLEYPGDIFKGMAIAMRAVGAARGILGIEANKPDAVEVLRRHVPDASMSVEVCETKYPQGAEKMLIKALLDREVPSGGLPADCGVAAFNVATLAQIGELLPMQRGLIERVVTITGPGVTKPGNYLMPIGTPLRYALDYAGYHGDDVTRVILGGPMMGPTVGSVDIPVTKGVSGILVLTREGLPSEDDARILPCIRCASCLKACPMHLNPSHLGALARKSEYDTMAEKFHLMDCFECGSCSFACPSNIPLVQYFRIAKSIVRDRQAARKAAAAKQ